PTYHHANVIDDHFMHISHIIRADEWIPSVPKHILLYRAYGWEPPLMAHLPVILDPSGKGKMSKRKAEASGYKIFIHELRESGYLPEAVFNFLATIGWSLDGRTEVFDRETAIQHFSIEAVNPAPAALPYQKLDWLNGVYIRNLDVDELHKRLIPFLSRDLGLDEETLRTSRELQVLVPHIQERIKTLSDAAALVDFAFTNRMEYDPKLLIGRKMTAAESLAALQAARRVLAELPEFSEESQEQALRGLAKELGLKAGQLFGILRVAATGKTVTPPLFGTFAALGRERLLRRLDEAEAKLAALVDEQMM
ncbi:MAG TPA: glutamate--tRNA ligase, partial [Anaerolineae bacterium]|nr:glutamate--tRNA ligase [Anaerolineae bacterium]